MISEEDHSLDYIEDPYFNPQDSTTTPSLDELDDVEYLSDQDILDNELELFDLRQLDFDELNGNSLPSLNGIDESVNVEAEFFNVKRANAIIRAFFKKGFKRQVRVTYCDLTKPYLAKLPKESNFRKYLDISVTDEATIATEGVAPDLSQLSVEEQEQQRAVWKAELAQIEDEIATLRTVLGSKMRRSAELKRNLGITVWKEISEDMNQGIKNVKESNVYQTVEQKMGQVSKAVTDAPIYQKTTSVIGGITGSITNKLGQMRHSESFKSIEERVGSAYENVKLMECGTCSETFLLKDVNSHPCFFDVENELADEENETEIVNITVTPESDECVAKSKRFWSHDETMALLSAVENHYRELHNPKEKKLMWLNVATDLENQGYDTKVSASRSGSMQNLDDAGRSRSGSVATSPTIDEEKPLA